MEYCHSLFLLVIATVTFPSSTFARAVNISNTWILPKENFPVFYRYFRDRISWYEADAVCQFHHGNLVTVDNSAQYDAIRAYLEELEVIDNVWIGLSKTTEKPDFAWSDFKPLTSEGHWQAAIPLGDDPLCVAMDPAADFLWKPSPCGGPEVASFICELSVPSWALGPKGCLLAELPSLTILYIPEQLALELTSDCGLEGTKRIACKGNANQKEMLKELSCNPNMDVSTVESTKTTKPWIWTSNTVDVDYGTRHRRETQEIPLSTKSTNFERKTEAATAEITALTSKSPELQLNLAELTTQDTSPLDSKLGAEDSAEYPSAINQGQLFSIIENGTMFDIIELNETLPDESKMQKSATTQESVDNLYTTVMYHKEPPSEPHYVTNKSEKKTNKSAKKQIFPKKLNYLEDKNKQKTPNQFESNRDEMSKEVEIFPILTNSLVKLNRTNRKELPDFNVELPKPNRVDLRVDNKLVSDLANKSLIDPKIESLNRNLTENNDSESVSINNETDLKEQFLPKSLLGEAEDMERSQSMTEINSLDAIPEPQSRPNRNRKLTQPQRRSYFPYFFSRVLG